MYVSVLSESPGDYRAVAVMQTLNACRIRLCWYISIVDDTIDESDESFSFTLVRTAGLDPRITLSPSAGEIIVLDAETSESMYIKIIHGC